MNRGEHHQQAHDGFISAFSDLNISTSWIYFLDLLPGSTSWLKGCFLHTTTSGHFMFVQIVLFFMFMEVLSERKYTFKVNASSAFVI